jgi:hypothetical protein
MPVLLRSSDANTVKRVSPRAVAAWVVSLAKARPRHFATASVSLTLLMAAFGYVALRPAGPDDIAHATIHALRNRDVDTLLRLSIPEELQKLNMTRDNVTLFLNRTIWSTGDLPETQMERLVQYPVDEVAYRVVPLKRDPKHHFPMRLPVTQTPQGTWRLSLGELLLSAVFTSDGSTDNKVTRRNWFIVCQQTGVRGYRSNTLGYRQAMADGTAEPF